MEAPMPFHVSRLPDEPIVVVESVRKPDSPDRAAAEFSEGRSFHWANARLVALGQDPAEFRLLIVFLVANQTHVYLPHHSYARFEACAGSASMVKYNRV